jgi:hypothetical protein
VPQQVLSVVTFKQTHCHRHSSGQHSQNRIDRAPFGRRAALDRQGALDCRMRWNFSGSAAAQHDVLRDPGRYSRQRTRTLDRWSCQVLEAQAARLAALMPERAYGRPPQFARGPRRCGTLGLDPGMRFGSCVTDSSVWLRRISRFSSKEHPVHSRTAISLMFSVRLPSVEAKGRWRERGRMGR